ARRAPASATLPTTSSFGGLRWPLVPYRKGWRGFKGPARSEGPLLSIPAQRLIDEVAQQRAIARANCRIRHLHHPDDVNAIAGIVPEIGAGGTGPDGVVGGAG